jgi:putative oxidoreductase
MSSAVVWAKEGAMLESIFAPYSDWGLLILRVALGIVMIAHGWPKLNPNGPMKGPAGFAGFLKQLGVPLPTFFAWIVALLETVGAVLLILGLGTRILAVGYVIDMVVAIRLVRIGMAKSPFAGGEGIGWEYEFILAAVALALLFTGAGSIALDPIVGL